MSDAMHGDGTTKSDTARAPSKRAHTRSGQPWAERRHSFRIEVRGRASLWRNNQLLGHYGLRDLCIAGCALVGRPNVRAGDRVELLLHVEDERPLWLSATVQRSLGAGLALRFDRPNARMEDRLQDLVVGTYARTHGSHESFSLVVEPNSALRRELVQTLDALGVRAVGVATPLDAVQLLLERGDRVENAFVGPLPRSATGSFELVEFLARHYPNVRRVLIGDARALGASWEAQAAGEVDALLETPCNEDALRRLVHRLELLPRDALRTPEPTTDA